LNAGWNPLGSDILRPLYFTDVLQEYVARPINSPAAGITQNTRPNPPHGAVNAGDNLTAFPPLDGQSFRATIVLESSFPICQTFAVCISSSLRSCRKTDTARYSANDFWERFVKQLAICMVLAVMAGCAQLPANTASQADKPPVSNDVISFAIPPDALGARDPQLSAVLAKAGALAASQKQPTTILVTALGQDLPYLNQAIWRGVPSQHPAKLSLENQTAGGNQPYSVSIRPTAATP
jgi:hypothetical protein